MTHRRSFLAALAAGALLGNSPRPAPAAAARGAPPVPRAARPLRLLVLGGSVFIGRHAIDYALARGHSVTMFNRGRTNPGLFPEVEKLQGDRKDDLRALGGRQWDVVLDTSGFVPSQVRASAALLAPQVQHYLFISSVSVYRDWRQPNDEDSPLDTLADPRTETVDAVTYGPLKALCERALQEVLPGRNIVVRPGYVVGPEDPTDRFTYWPVRVARGGEMLAPGSARDPMQFIDVRDLARWCVHCLEQRIVGTFNAVHPPGFTTIGEVLQLARKETKSDARFTWVPADFLAAHKVALPIWAPPHGETAALARTSARRAQRAGLRTTPLADTIRDTLAWWNARPAAEQQLQAGPAAEREAQLLRDWHAARSRRS